MRIVLTLLLAAGAVLAADMGKNIHFTLRTSPVTETFTSVQDELRDDEVLKVQLYPTGKKDARPSEEAPVLLWISTRDESHHWVLPWQPDGGHKHQWLEVLLCHNERSLELMAETTNATTPLPMRWKVSTENVKLRGRLTTMKSTPADVSYRRFSWPDTDSVAVKLTVTTIAGRQVCASLAVARRCVTHPHQLTDSHLLQRVRFARTAAFTVSRTDAPDGFWLYLIPESDNTKCAATEGRGLDSLPPRAKTIQVSTQTQAFTPGGTTERPTADDELPSGVAVTADADGGDWASQFSQCEQRLAECEQQHSCSRA